MDGGDLNKGLGEDGELAPGDYPHSQAGDLSGGREYGNVSSTSLANPKHGVMSSNPTPMKAIRGSIVDVRQRSADHAAGQLSRCMQHIQETSCRSLRISILFAFFFGSPSRKSILSYDME